MVREKVDPVVERAALQRAKIINDAEAMTRLVASKDFTRFCEILLADKSGLNKTLLNENMLIQDRMTTDLVRVRLIARINQIDKVLNKPGHAIWKAKNLTEVRAAIKEKQTRVRQAHGNKTGGNK